MEQTFQKHRLPATDAWGRQKSITDYSLFHGLFTYAIHPGIWHIVEDGVEVASSAGATSSGGMLKLMTGSGVDSILVQSYRHPRYQPNRGILYSASWILPNWQTAGVVLDVGLFNDTESGLFFRVSAGRVYAVRVTNGVEHIEEIALPAGADLSKGCLYDIQAQWRGIGSFFFYITHNKGTTVHTVSLLGTLTAISINNPAMSVAQRMIGAAAIAYCGCIDYTSEGGIDARLVYGSAIVADLTLSTGGGLIAIRQPALIGGHINSRDLQLARITIQADKKSRFALYMSRDPGSVTATGWTGVNSGSYVEKANSITATNITNATLISTFSVPAGGTVERDNPIPSRVDFYISAGFYAFVRCDSGATVTATVIVEWGEEV